MFAAPSKGGQSVKQKPEPAAAGTKRPVEQGDDGPVKKRPSDAQAAEVALDEAEQPMEGVVSAQNEDEGGAGWLNSLTARESQLLYKVLIVQGKGYKLSTVGLTDAQVKEVMELTAGSPASDRDGSWWINHITCHISGLTAQAGHPRVAIETKFSALLPSPGSTLRSIFDTLGKGPGNRLISLGQALGLRGKSGRSQVKLQAHWIAFRAAAASDSEKLLPVGLGKGGSISHLCDVTGCLRADHLESTPKHADNMVRQRCPGVVLLTLRGMIVQEVPCKHGKGKSDTLLGDLMASCRKIVPCEIGQGVVDLIQNTLFD